jgi:hypothetical protein
MPNQLPAKEWALCSIANVWTRRKKIKTGEESVKSLKNLIADAKENN